MKQLIFTFLLSAILAPIAQAGGLGLFYGYMNTDDLDSSSGPGAKLRLDLSDWAGLELKGMYMEGFESDLDGALDQTKLDLTIIPAEIGLAVDLPIADRVRPYLGAGFGYYNIELENTSEFADAGFDLDDQVGWYGTLGLRLPLSRFTLFADAQVRQIEGSFKIDQFSRIKDEEFDFDLSGWGATAGIMLNW